MKRAWMVAALLLAGCSKQQEQPAIVQQTSGKNSPAISGVSGDLVIDGRTVSVNVTTGRIIEVVMPNGEHKNCVAHTYDEKPFLDLPLQCDIVPIHP